MKGAPALLAALGNSCRHRLCTWNLSTSSRTFGALRALSSQSLSTGRPSLISTPRSFASGSSPVLNKLRTTNGLRSYSVKNGVLSFAGRKLQPRFFSSNSTFQAAVDQSAELPVLSPPSVGRWLIVCSMLAFGVIVVGGVTRLTESGLSITEWKPVAGVLPPITQAEWEEEFTKYKATPEFKMYVTESVHPRFNITYPLTANHFLNLFSA